MVNIAERLEKCHGLFNIINGYNSINFNRTERNFLKEEEDMIQKSWDYLLKAGKVKFSSELVALRPELTFARDGILNVTAYKTDYKHYRTTLEHPSIRVWLTGPSAILRFNEGGEMTYIFGERKSSTSDVGGKLECVPAGYLEAAHFHDENPFLITLYGELKEEIGIPQDKIAKVEPFWYGQVRNMPGNNRLVQDICVDFIMDIENLPSTEIKEMFSAGKREHERLYFIKEGELERYCEGNFDRLSARTKCSMANLIPRIK